MALNPKNRYQQVAELANDLRQVVAALPPPPMPPTPPIRSVDPNSTVPDLSGFHEAHQEAKEKKQQGSGDASPVLPPNTANITCPRCGKSLEPKAIFCPNCGTVLSKQANQSPSNQQAQRQNTPLRNAPIEKTQLAVPNTPPNAMAIHHVKQAEATVSAFSQHNQPQWQQLEKPTPSYGVQPQIAPQPVGPRGQKPTLQPSFAHLLFQYRLLILSIVLLIALLIVIFFLATGK